MITVFTGVVVRRIFCLSGLVILAHAVVRGKNVMNQLCSTDSLCHIAMTESCAEGVSVDKTCYQRAPTNSVIATPVYHTRCFCIHEHATIVLTGSSRPQLVRTACDRVDE